MRRTLILIAVSTRGRIEMARFVKVCCDRHRAAVIVRVIAGGLYLLLGFLIAGGVCGASSQRALKPAALPNLMIAQDDLPLPSILFSLEWDPRKPARSFHELWSVRPTGRPETLKTAPHEIDVRVAIMDSSLDAINLALSKLGEVAEPPDEVSHQQPFASFADRAWLGKRGSRLILVRANVVGDVYLARKGGPDRSMLLALAIRLSRKIDAALAGKPEPPPVLPLAREGGAVPTDVQVKFAALYRAWVGYRASVVKERSDLRSNLDPMIWYDHDSFRQIVALGVPVLPYAVAQVQKDHLLGYAIYKISKAKLHLRRNGIRSGGYVWTVDEFPDMHETHGPPDSRLLWKRWWNEYRPRIRARFEQLYGQWRTAQSQGKSAEAERLYGAMRDLGVLALPAITAHTTAGEGGLAPLISELTDGAVAPNATSGQISAWWTRDKGKWSLSAENRSSPSR